MIAAASSPSGAHAARGGAVAAATAERPVGDGVDRAVGGAVGMPEPTAMTTEAAIASTMVTGIPPSLASSGDTD